MADDLVTLSALLTTARQDLRTAKLASQAAQEALITAAQDVRTAEERLDAVRARVNVLLRVDVTDPTP